MQTSTNSNISQSHSITCRSPTIVPAQPVGYEVAGVESHSQEESGQKQAYRV